MENINRGTAPQDPTADDLYTASGIINSNNNEFNAYIVEVKNRTGGAQYIDDIYSELEPLTITQGNRVKLTCNNATVINNNIPSDFINGMWDNTNNKLLAVNNKDIFSTEIRFKAKNSVNNGFFDIEIDISGSVGVISRVSQNFTRSADTEQSFKPIFNYFTGTTFISNGGEIYINAVKGNLEIYDIEILPNRIHKGY